ncbi:hypothetical protein [Alloactinosynnema sp. L-07]|uniref:hypothetical protein n=1 Tax=Alloactinosynnema sp. L-07 TaxID=1653480 RepID=UPI00065EF19A|nr:hypothetical protein [Alloactinosynnema sp. L-07]CRK55652.1 hypothetical protein [Alloactinosynnema sp. L-07]
MTESTTDIVRAPFTDRPALSDPTTAILLRPMRCSQTLWRVVGVILGLSCALQWVAMAMSDDPVRTFFTSTVWSSVSFGVVITQLHLVRGHTAMSELLGAQAWRPVGVRVLRGTSLFGVSVVEVGDGVGPLRVFGASRAHLAVAVRTGTAWVVGPDGRGRAALRLEGSHHAWPARVHRRPVKPARVPAADSDASAMWARQSRSWWKAPENRRLGELLGAGEWTKVSASLAPWQARMDGTTYGVATLRLPDGRVLLAAMPAAPVDVLGTVWDTGSLWLVGQPEPGRTLAVGFPGYPLLTAATICEATGV